MSVLSVNTNKIRETLCCTENLNEWVVDPGSSHHLSTIIDGILTDCK